MRWIWWIICAGIDGCHDVLMKVEWIWGKAEDIFSRTYFTRPAIYLEIVKPYSSRH